MKARRDPEHPDTPDASEADAELARALKALAQDRPSAQELARVRARLEATLSQQTFVRSHAASMQSAAGLIVVGAALLSVLPTTMHLTRRIPEQPNAPSSVSAAATSVTAPSTPAAQCPPATAQQPCDASASASAPPSAAVAFDSPAPLPKRAQHESAHAASTRPHMTAPRSAARAEPATTPRASNDALRKPSQEPALAQQAAHANTAAAAQPDRQAAPRETPKARASVAAPALDEVTLLQEARKQASADPNAALHWLDEHKRRFPHGTLSPEREVMAIELLRSQSRAAEAERRAALFRRDFPGSIYLPRIAKAAAKP